MRERSTYDRRRLRILNPQMRDVADGNSLKLTSLGRLEVAMYHDPRKDDREDASHGASATERTGQVVIPRAAIFQ
jgi:hypothetical protein